MQEFILKNLITIIFIIFIVYGFVKGFAEGLLKKIFSFGSIILTIIATKIFTPIVAVMVKDLTNIEATLSDFIYSIFIKNNAYDKINFDDVNRIFNTGDIGVMIKEKLCTSIANVMINLMCGVCVFIVVLFTIKIVIKVLDIIDYIPVVGQLNKILGGVLGVMEIILIAWIVFTVFRVLENIPQINVIVENIRGSLIVGGLYENNAVYNFLANLFTAFKKV